jgi:Lon protease-like protein
MDPHSDAAHALAGFDGRARVFPLPNTVTFPGIARPIHVFEPRYRALVEEALASDGLLAMATLAPGWEPDYEGRPAVEPIACLCRIAAHHRLDDGRFNLMIVGLARLRLLREMPPTKPFRVFEAECLRDRPLPEGDETSQVVREKLLEGFERLVQTHAKSSQAPLQFAAGHSSLAMLTDAIAFAAPFGLNAKLAILAETDVLKRANLVLALLAQIGQSGTASGVSFPIDFSPN